MLMELFQYRELVVGKQLFLVNQRRNFPSIVLLLDLNGSQSVVISE